MLAYFPPFSVGPYMPYLSSMGWLAADTLNRNFILTGVHPEPVGRANNTKYHLKIPPDSFLVRV